MIEKLKIDNWVYVLSTVALSLYLLTSRKYSISMSPKDSSHSSVTPKASYASEGVTKL